MKRDIIGAAALGLALNGCAPAAHDPQYYALNQDERRAVLEACSRVSIARVFNYNDCVNAAAAIPIAENAPATIDPYAPSPKKKP